MPDHCDYLSADEIADWKPDRTPPEHGAFTARLAGRLDTVGQLTDDQIAGRRWGTGCVSLEITQRCNLDCTLCYLSDQSEAVHDLPLAEIYRRIDMIYRHYGPGTDVQVSGGDPTLRQRDELITIIRRISDMGMRPSLFTNGIRATRPLLQELAANGLVDVAFHVDLTQARKGFASERDLNAVRADYIERARGLGLSVFFNTTVFAGNFHEIAAIVRFFRKHTDVVRLASFQLQAETGRGVLRGRDTLITQDSVAAQISRGAGTQVCFDIPRIGHPRCNRYGICLEAGGTLYNLYDKCNRDYLVRVFQRLTDLTFDRRSRRRVLATLLHALWRNPDLWAPSLRFALSKAWQMRYGLVRARGRINKLSFFIHNFMDAERLERDRCLSCIFMVATPDGLMSMCVHNAKRDDYILKPLAVETPAGPATWHPLTGYLAAPEGASQAPTPPPLKRLKGRPRQRALIQRRLAASDAD